LAAKARPETIGARARAAMPYFRAAVPAVRAPPPAAEAKVDHHSARELAT
jgi:hypothetical protein